MYKGCDVVKQPLQVHRQQTARTAKLFNDMAKSHLQAALSNFNSSGEGSITNVMVRLPEMVTKDVSPAWIPPRWFMSNT